jgi:tetratricopeptide (TPR) repeat protein
LLSRLAIALIWSGDDYRIDQLTNEAVAMARESGDDDSIRHALCARHAALWDPARRTERKSLIEEFGQAIESANSPGLKLMHLLFNITFLMEGGDVNGARTEMAKFTRLAESLSLPHFLWQARLFESNQLLLAGNFDEASAKTKLALDLGLRAQSHNAIHSCGTQSVLIGWERGQSTEILEQSSEYFAQYPTVVAWQAVQAVLASEIDQRDEARRLLAQARTRGFDTIPKNEAWTVTLNLFSMAAAQLDDKSSAGDLLELLEPTKDLMGCVGFAIASWGAQARTIGQLAMVLGRFDQAVKMFEKALEVEDRVGAIPWLAHSHYLLASCLRQRNRSGDFVKAREHEAIAASIADRLGMLHLARKIPRP